MCCWKFQARNGLCPSPTEHSVAQMHTEPEGWPAGLVAIVQTFVIAAAAAAFQLAFIIHNSFGLVVLLLLMVNLAMMSFGFFIR